MKILEQRNTKTILRKSLDGLIIRMEMAEKESVNQKMDKQKLSTVNHTEKKNEKKPLGHGEQQQKV